MADPHDILVSQARNSLGDIENFGQGTHRLGTFRALLVLVQLADGLPRGITESSTSLRKQGTGPGDAICRAVGQHIAQLLCRVQHVRSHVVSQPGQTTLDHPIDNTGTQLIGGGSGETAREFMGLIDDQCCVLWQGGAAMHRVDRDQGMIGDYKVSIARRLP